MAPTIRVTARSDGVILPRPGQQGAKVQAMPPHCDSMDGPVVTAAREALERNDVTVIPPFVPALAEDEVAEAFDATRRARPLGPDAA